MLPVLLDLKFVKIYTFGVFLVLSFFWGMFLLWRSIKLTSYKEEEIFDSLFIALFGGLFFARLFYVLLNFSDFGFNLLKFILINGYPGLSLFGGLLGGFLSLYLYFQLKKADPLAVISYFMPSVFISLAIGKIGSFIAGIDVGTKTKFFLSVNYLGFDGRRHLVGLYEGLFFGLGAYISYKILLAVRREVFPKSFVFYFFCFYFSTVSLLLDKLKANHLYFFGRSFNLFFSLILSFVFAIYFIYFLGRQPSFQEQMDKAFNSLKLSFINYGQKTYQIITGKIKKGVDKTRERIDKKD